jgi:hypothetical protein
MEENPIQAAKKLQQLLNTVLDSIKMASNPREKIAAALAKTSEIVAILEGIHNNVVPLDIKNGDSDLAENLACWKKAPAGVLMEGTHAYEKLISRSETLRAIYGTGINIPSITKFSDEEIRLAKGFGNRYLEFHSLLRTFSASINSDPRRSKSIFTQVTNAELEEKFFSMLKEFNVIDELKVYLYVHKESRYVDSNFEILKNLSMRGRHNRTRIDFNLKNPQYLDLIRGHWFNAYAYHVIDDHLARNHFDYEIYTRVSYTAPADIIRSGGDFDVIAMVGSKVLLVECKSGELKKERDDFEKIIEKTECIKKVFEYTKAEYYEYIFLLIYNHFVNSPDEISKYLDGTGIKPVKPDQIRGTVIELFKKSELH